MQQRKLGFWEAYCKYGHDCFSGTGNMTARIFIQGDLNQEILFQSFKQLYHRHPLLRAVMCDIKHQYYFQLSADFENIIINFENHQDWQKAVDDEMHLKFETQKSLWRAKILSDQNKHHILVTFHHAIADGLSGAFFQDQLLKTYANLKSNSTFNLPSLSLQPSVENCLEKTNSWEAFTANKKDLKRQMPMNMEYHQFAKLSQRKTRTIYQSIDKQQLTSLINSCREHETTINGYLNALMLKTLAKLSELSETSLHTPVNLRKQCKPVINDEHMGCYISMVTTIHHQLSTDMDVWQTAREYRNQLNENILKTGLCPREFHIADFDILELTQIFDMPGSTKRKMYSSGFGISNIGKVNLARFYGDIELKEYMFTTNREMGDFVIFVNVATLHDAMQLAFCYCEPLLDNLWIKQFVDCFMHELNSL